MRRKGGALRHCGFAGAGALALALSACMGGTGTDTENGLVLVNARVLSPDGAPLAGVELSILRATARVDSSMENPLANPDKIPTTDNEGYARFRLKQEGVYIAEGIRGDSVLFIDTLRTPEAGSLPSGFGSIIFQAKVPIRTNGRVRLLSGYLPDSGRIFLHGTRLKSDVEGDGSYDLALLPLSAEKLIVTVVYSARPAETRYVKVAGLESGVTVFAAAGSESSCLSDSAAAVTAGQTVNGSLDSPADRARVAGAACAGRTGALVRMLRVDSSGAALGPPEDFVVTAADAPFGGDSTAVPLACVLQGAVDATGRATLRLAAKETVVDDIVRGPGCLEE